jgi:hypothetical protein
MNIKQIRVQNLLEVNQIITYLKSSIHTISSDELVKLISTLTTGMIYQTLKINDVSFYRIVKNEDGQLFTNTKRIWYPPKEHCKIGRLNGVGKPLLYLADSVSTAVKEVKPPKNSIFTLVCCHQNQELNIIPLGIKPNITRTTIFNDSYWDKLANAKLNFYNFNSELVKVENVIFDFLNSEITKLVADGDENEYKLTSHYAEHILQSIAEGIVYPSVTRDHLDINFAIQPESAKKIKITHIIIFKMIDEKIGTFRVIGGSNKFDSNGDIVYNNYIGEFKGADRIFP